MDEIEPKYLNDLWTLYFHSTDCDDWDITSYSNICNISSIEEFVIVFHQFRNIWDKGMFFLMRDGINPNWEDKQNITGGCYSVKYKKEECVDKWFELCCTVLGETFAKSPEHTMNINGISISPKRDTNLIRIWMKDNNHINKDFYNFNTPKFAVVIYKKHTN
jgi:hypothetical protein